MKKTMLSAALVLVMGFGMANTALASEKAQAMEIAQQQAEVSYAEISSDELPEAITVALTDTAYADYTISKAFLGSDESYKVVLSKDDTEAIAIFFKADGEVIKTEEIEA